VDQDTEDTALVLRVTRVYYTQAPCQHHSKNAFTTRKPCIYCTQALPRSPHAAGYACGERGVSVW
jgi:hypothetical protein